MKSRIEDVAEEIRLARAINRGDRPTLLAATGRAGIIARSFARGEDALIRACMARFSDSTSPIFGPWLRWLASPDLGFMAPPDVEAFGRAYVADLVLYGFEGEWPLEPQEFAACSLQNHQRDENWRRWDEEMYRARIALPWHPRLAIAEARAQRVRGRESALRILRGSLDRFPDHFTIAQMYGMEIFWALGSEWIERDEALRLWAPLERFLALDPDDVRLLTCKVVLHHDVPEVPTPETMNHYGLVDRVNRLLDEIDATPVD